MTSMPINVCNKTACQKCLCTEDQKKNFPLSEDIVGNWDTFIGIRFRLCDGMCVGKHRRAPHDDEQLAVINKLEGNGDKEGF